MMKGEKACFGPNRFMRTGSEVFLHALTENPDDLSSGKVALAVAGRRYKDYAEPEDSSVSRGLAGKYFCLR